MIVFAGFYRQPISNVSDEHLPRHRMEGGYIQDHQGRSVPPCRQPEFRHSSLDILITQPSSPNHRNERVIAGHDKMEKTCFGFISHSLPTRFWIYAKSWS